MIGGYPSTTFISVPLDKVASSLPPMPTDSSGR